jgi:hypothetical protein
MGWRWYRLVVAGQSLDGWMIAATWLLTSVVSRLFFVAVGLFFQHVLIVH